jgi:hypothetical protein
VFSGADVKAGSPSPVEKVPPGTKGSSVEKPGDPVLNGESPVEKVAGIVLLPSPSVKVGADPPPTPKIAGSVFASPVWKVFGIVLLSPSWKVPVGVPKSTPTWAIGSAEANALQQTKSQHETDVRPCEILNLPKAQ